jgi:hypothetical protein
MDYEMQRSARSCSVTGREFAPGEQFYSVLIAEGAELRRADYSLEAWQGPPPAAVGWWKSQVPDQRSRARWAPNEVLLHFFDELAGQADKQNMRYVLALLLVRRRVMRLEAEERDEQGREVLMLYCPRRETTYEVPAIMPDEKQRDEIQQELAKLLAP